MSPMNMKMKMRWADKSMKRWHTFPLLSRSLSSELSYEQLRHCVVRLRELITIAGASQRPFTKAYVKHRQRINVNYDIYNNNSLSLCG